MSIEIRNLTKRFGATVACGGIDLDIPSGELVALLGPSGCGKTTLLRIVAGLEVPDGGSVLFHGEDATRTHVRERNVGFVFQHYALFGHMTIFENVAFGLRVRPRATRPGRAEIEDRVMRLLKLVQLDWLAQRYPHQLSGGQRQRIALARALAVEPRVLLLDEPFGALDAKVRKELRRWLRRLHDEVHVTSVFVTHDQDEAMEVADRVVVMNQGRVEQQGSPDEVYDHPATPFVLQFLGDVNLFHGRYGPAGPGEAAPRDGGHDDVAYVRPHELEIVAEAGDDTWPVTLSQTLTVGPNTRIEFRRDGYDGFVDVELPRQDYAALRERLGLRPGARAYLRPRRVTRFAQGPERALALPRPPGGSAAERRSG
ncbi:MAG: sulfate ABC transporter ATP-binding protein [Burkholderiales bacterium]|nr:sulfate ABC transporter ATP-binding protein [Burkholderiales bacterium]OJX07802.1 MAG: sulfate ABC transporter ATP-binding protein [Burkholderiales bacterium 70-64]